jgi:predicted dehydrogenase
MSKVRIGIIGFGGMGEGHAGYLLKNMVPGAELTAICEGDGSRLKWARETYGEKIQYFQDPDSFFNSKSADAVVIATPHYQHPPLAIQAFKHGLHVLTEKPAGVHPKHVREMNEAAQKSGKVFAIVFQMRMTGAYQKIRDLVSSGELGTLRRTTCISTDCFRSQAYYDSGSWRATWAGEGGGVLLNQCPHILDIWQWLVGMPTRLRAFCAFGKWHKIEVEDDVTAYLEYPNGATGVFVASTGESPGSSSLEIVGDRGRLLYESGKLTFARTRQPVSEYCSTTKERFARPESWVCEIPFAPGGGRHDQICQGFVDAIVKGTPPVTRGEEGMNSLQLANAMLLSTWTNDWVNLPVDEDLYLAKLQAAIQRSKTKT